MPWVRLHATKGYLDMVWLAEQFPELRCTFNLTPVLLKQIEELAQGDVRDLWRELAETPAGELTAAQRSGVLEHFFKANHEHMIRPFPRYWSLLQKRGARTTDAVALERLAGGFSEQECRDIQVWFNLTWFGYAGERLYPEIAELKAKGRDFTEEDKRVVLDLQQTVLRTVVGYYRVLAERGQIEISTTPFYHPILPLVYNTDHARRCMPGAKLPPVFSHPEDARAQLQLAREYHSKLFGQPPRGVWPSEGSVCPELVPLMREVGFEWFATDEEILWRSLGAFEETRPRDRTELYRGYQVEFGSAAINAAFRDRTLSDFIGFSAARNEPRRAAEYMISHLEGIARAATDDEALCALILDGENAWENFPDGGEGFLRELYRQLVTNPKLRTATFQEHFRAHPPVETIRTLHTGSWIHADFKIWIGDPEDNRGWELLGRTRDLLQAKINRHELTDEQRAKALKEIYAAEGSDWFWWYGDEFVTDNDLLFDELFRTHLQNVYHILGLPVPDALQVQICRSEVTHETRQPTELITPVVDGLITSYYEWAGAAVYEAGRSMAAMYRSERLVESIHFGGDLEKFAFRLDLRGEPGDLPPDLSLRINFLEPASRALVVPELKAGAVRAELLDTTNANGVPVGGTPEMRIARILELTLSYAALEWQPRDRVRFFVQLLREGVEVERHPSVGLLSFSVPDELFEVENWRI
jgi:alpha-amylase/alpha-mannosidase (GH57 family)